MRAAVCAAYGEPEVVEIREVPAPSVAPGQAVVRIEAAAVNFPDVLIVANRYQISAPVPFIPGSEFAGRVLEVGPGVQGVPAGVLSVGDRVFGSTMVGAFAEQVAVSISSLTSIPDGVEAGHAAAFGVAHRTAYHVLRSVASLQPGEELVVLGAGGGVGLAAVQLGAVLGATVTAVASADAKLGVARDNGATRTVNHRAGDLRQALKDAIPGGADVVVDPVGGSLSEPALRCLHAGGRFVTVGYAAGEIPRIPLNLVLLKGITILGFEFRTFSVREPETMSRGDAELMDLLASKRVVPHVGASFSLERAAEALRYVADGQAIGKVIVEV